MIGDRFLPPGLTDPAAIRRTRGAILQSLMGLFFTLTMGALYAVFGSPWSGAAISLITLALLGVPFAIRRGVSTVWIGNGTLGLTWVATAVVACRSGGAASPALVWCFLLPLMAYLACGMRWVVVWSVLSSLLLLAFFLAGLEGVAFAQDFSPALLSMLRVSGYAGVVLAVLEVLFVVENVRVATQDALLRANQTLERQRILADMHDGVGGQLMGLIHQAPDRLVPGLQSCLDDLRLIVDSMDPVDRPLEAALAELRARLQPRCDAAGVELAWTTALPPTAQWTPTTTLQLLRALQEMLSNALAHAQARRIEVAISSDAKALMLSVRDDGVGFDADRPPRAGRGLKSLRARAQKLDGQVRHTPAAPGTRVVLTCPIPTS